MEMQNTSLKYSPSNKSIVVVRKGGLADLSVIYRIEKESFNNPYSPELILNLFALYPYGFYVAEGVDGVVGYVIFRFVGLKGHIIALAVDKSYRNNKIGSRLLSKALEVFRERGADGAWLEVRASNLQALKFYLTKGFNRIHSVKNYYRDGEDGDILYLTLSS